MPWPSVWRDERLDKTFEKLETNPLFAENVRFVQRFSPWKVYIVRCTKLSAQSQDTILSPAVPLWCYFTCGQEYRLQPHNMRSPGDTFRIDRCDHTTTGCMYNLVH